jgi:hypothetical protein
VHGTTWTYVKKAYSNFNGQLVVTLTGEGSKVAWDVVVGVASVPADYHASCFFDTDTV